MTGQFLRFASIGAAGFIVDAGVLSLMRWLGLDLYFSRALSFLAAVTFTWLCNRRFTFPNNAKMSLNAAEWAHFAAINSVGGAVNLLTFAFLVTSIETFAHVPVLAIAVGSLAGLAFNFLGSAMFVYRDRVGHGGPVALEAEPDRAVPDWSAARKLTGLSTAVLRRTPRDPAAQWRTSMNAISIDRTETGNIARTVSWAVAIAFLSTVIFFIASHASLNRSLDKAIANVQEAFISGDLLAGANRAPGNTTIGIHQYNDCLIIGMSIDQRPGFKSRLAVSPILTHYTTPPPSYDAAASLHSLRLVDRAAWHHPCPTLHRLAGGEQPSQDVIFYNRYMHGHTILARYLLPIASIRSIRLMYSLLLTALVMAGVLYCCFKMAAGVRLAHFTVWLIIFFGFARWFGLESYAQSFSHAPSDAIVLGYLLFLCISSAKGLAAPTLIKSASIFGALTMMFEFLTGGLPLGLAIVLGALPMALRSDEKDFTIGSTAFHASIAFGTAAVICLVLKVCLALLLFGPVVIHNFVGQLGVWTAFPAEPGLPWDGLWAFIWTVAVSLGVMAGKMSMLAALAVSAAVMFGAWGAAVILRSATSARLKDTTWLLLVSNAPIAIWLVAFWHHTIVHAWFMDRIFVWTLATGFSLFAMGLFHRWQGGTVGRDDRSTLPLRDATPQALR